MLTNCGRNSLRLSSRYVASNGLSSSSKISGSKSSQLKSRCFSSGVPQKPDVNKGSDERTHQETHGKIHTVILQNRGRF